MGSPFRRARDREQEQERERDGRAPGRPAAVRPVRLPFGYGTALLATADSALAKPCELTAFSAKYQVPLARFEIV